MGKSVLVLAALLLWPLAGQAEETVRTIDEQFPAEGIPSIKLQFSVGDLVVEAADTHQVQVHLEMTCSSLAKRRCVDLARELRLSSSTAGDQLSIQLEGWPRHRNRSFKMTGRVVVPKHIPLLAWLDVGDLTVNGLENDLTINLDVGDVHVNMSEAAVASADLDSGIGKTSLLAGGRIFKSRGLGREIRWREGTGRAALRIDCGVGDIAAELR